MILLDHDVHCDHAVGRDQLLDDLSDGTLTSEQQVALSLLLSPMADVRVDFRTSELDDYEIVQATEDQAWETWTCPVCGEVHGDWRDA